MPEISRFKGMVIRMFYQDHEIKHIHVYSAGRFSKIDFNGKVIKGYLPPNKLNIISKWIELHKKELENNWIKIRNKEFPERIEPWKK